MDTTTAAQTRLRDELLAWGVDRPRVDEEVVDQLRDELEQGAVQRLRAHGALGSDEDPGSRPGRGDAVFVSKSRLDRLVCDGLYRAALDEPFSWSRPVAAGTLSHLAIQRDHDTRRTLTPARVVAAVWHEAVTRPGDTLAAWCNQLDDVAAAALRSEVEQLLTEHRDVWPTLPSTLHPRFERSARVQLAGGRVVLLGTPDLTLGRVRDDRARMLLVDFKTGLRRPQQERQELRFYALLLTLKHRQPPFRWASYYVAEGAWDVEDFSVDALRAAVRMTLDGIDQALRLADADATERLRAGRWCRFCPRRDTCEEYLSQGTGTLEP